MIAVNRYWLSESEMLRPRGHTGLSLLVVGLDFGTHWPPP